MASMACCPAGAEPLREMKDYKPKHTMLKIESLSCYVATPKVNTTKAVIVFADMFGVHTGRHKQFCDMLAEKGYLAVCPDFFALKGRYTLCAPSFGMNYCCAAEFLLKFFTGYMDRKTRTFAWDTFMKQKVMDELLPWMKTSHGVQSFAALGFCWGTYGSLKCAAYPEFRCCVGFHPSNEGFCKAAKEDDLQACREIKCPQLMIATKGESARWKPEGEAHKACLAAMPGQVTWDVVEANHGYMSRGDTAQPETLEAATKGVERMMAFFKEHL
ncbi:unnamed protein product [Effrenium voratum]|nr:unnamed protein product [Effrenium voratum]